MSGREALPPWITTRQRKLQEAIVSRLYTTGSPQLWPWKKQNPPHAPHGRQDSWPGDGFLTTGWRTVIQAEHGAPTEPGRQWSESGVAGLTGMRGSHSLGQPKSLRVAPQPALPWLLHAQVRALAGIFPQSGPVGLRTDHRARAVLWMACQFQSRHSEEASLARC